LLFPGASTDLRTPADFVPKQSSVACVLQCGGIWIGGKGWGLTWKLVQCVVKPREVISIFGKCQVQLSSEERAALESDGPNVSSHAADPDEVEEVVAPTVVADSDDEAPAAAVPVKKVVKKIAPSPPVVEPVVASPVQEPVAVAQSQEEPVAVAQEEPVVAAPVVVKKKVVKKSSA